MKKLIASSAALLLLGAVAARADMVVANSDLLLGLSISGATTDLEINLGAYNPTFNTNGGTSATNWSLDLSNVLSAAGVNLGAQDVKWAVIGAKSNTDTAKTTYITHAWQQDGTAGVAQALPWTVNAAIATTQSNVLTVYNGARIGSNNIAGFSNATTVLNTASNSFSAQTLGAAAFNLNPNEVFASLIAGVNSSSSSDLWTLTKTAATYNGAFTLDDAGLLTFTAVPEPSTYAMILAGLTLGVVAYRRRFAKTV